MACSTASGTPRRLRSFNTGGKVSNVQGDDLIVRMIVSIGTFLWTIVRTSLLFREVISSVSAGSAETKEGVKMRNSPIASGKNALFTANSFQSSRRRIPKAGTIILTEVVLKGKQ